MEDYPPALTDMDRPELGSHNDDIPEEDSDGQILSPTEQSAFSPPARIAARFYRNSPLARRKSSATSSRRNSLSSTHSMQSNSSYRAACKSNHVAQYLRRASILEGRKARLAAREAHAEQVRLRAALARTAARASNSEERALAAKQARDERLANVAAACAEEVRRAKRVAEETRERRAAEEERYRVEMEEKMADAEKRRLEYMRNSRRPRTASSPPTADLKPAVVHEAQQLDKDVAAKRIQLAWRTRRRRKTFHAFAVVGLSIDTINDTTFEEIRALLCEEHVVKATIDLLHLLRVDCGDKVSAQQLARTFLTAYLLLGYPAQVMSPGGQDGELEQTVLQRAKELIMAFERCLASSTAYNRYATPTTQLEALHLAHAAYITTFEDWKTKDKTILIELVVQDFVNLDSIWQSVKDDTDGQVADDYHAAIRESQVQLLVKLRRLAGQERANQLIRKAIRESRRQNHRKKPVGDVRPRAAANAQTGGNKIHPEISNGEGSSAVVDNAQIAAPAPPSDAVQTKSIASVFSSMPSNRIVTHELVLDKDYRVDTAPQTAARDEINRKICDSMLEAFKTGEGDRWTVAVAENIRAKLLHLLVGPKGEGSMYHIISESLDPVMVQRQCAQGVFSYQKFFDFVASILPKLCAPVRDAEVEALAQELREYGSPEDMIEKLFKLFHIIDVLALDYSNFLLSNVAPRLIKEAPAYEQRLFAKDLAEGTTTLQKTKRWWNNASVNVLTEADRLDPSYRPTLQKIYARGLVDLAVAMPPLRDADIPETLEMDQKRLSRFREHTLRIAVIGTILLGAKNLLKRDVRSQWKTEANRMWDAVVKHGYAAAADDPSRLLSIIESSHPLPPATKTQLSATITRLLAQAHASRLTDPVAKVLHARLRQHIFARIAASSSNERVRAVSTASESLSTAGLPEFGAVVAGIVDLLARVGDADRRAHGLWYEQVAAEATGAEDAAAEH